jgi:hypothetical protein
MRGASVTLDATVRGGRYLASNFPHIGGQGVACETSAGDGYSHATSSGTGNRGYGIDTDWEKECQPRYWRKAGWCPHNDLVFATATYGGASGTLKLMHSCGDILGDSNRCAFASADADISIVLPRRLGSRT